MRRLILLFGLGVLIATAFLVVPAFGANGTTTCNGALAAGTYNRVVVPQDGVCLSDGPVTIRAGLFVQQGGTLVFGSEESPVHTATINGGVNLSGGAGPFGGPFDITWNTIEDSVINGGYTEAGYNGFWNGFIRNTVHGPVNLFGNVVADPDGNEVVTNTIYGSLNCAGNDPAPQVGDSEGSPNHVTGPETGQCVGL